MDPYVLRDAPFCGPRERVSHAWRQSLQVSILPIYSCSMVHTVPRSASGRSLQRTKSTGWRLYNPSHPTTLTWITMLISPNPASLLAPPVNPRGPAVAFQFPRLGPAVELAEPKPAMITDPNPPFPSTVACVTVLPPTTSCPAGSNDTDSPASTDADRVTEPEPFPET